MKSLQNVEVFFIEEPNASGEMFAWISYRDPQSPEKLTDGYDHIRVPVNLRPIQLSSRDNVLVNQSERQYAESSNEPVKSQQ